MYIYIYTIYIYVLDILESFCIHQAVALPGLHLVVFVNIPSDMFPHSAVSCSVVLLKVMVEVADDDGKDNDQEPRTLC